MSEDTFDRSAIWDEAAERVVLGGMMMSADVIGDVANMLKSSDFYRPAHQLIYEALLDLYGSGDPTEPVAVAGKLTAMGELGRVGGLPELFQLYRSAPLAQSATYYAQTVLGCSVQRQLEELGDRTVQLARTEGLSIEERIATVAAAFEAKTDRTATDNGDATVADLMIPFLDRLEDHTPEEITPLGWKDLDALLDGGLRPGQLVVVGARPGMGKSVFMLNAAFHVGVNLRLPVLFSSLEMSKLELMERMVANAGAVPLHAIRTRQLSDDDWKYRLNKATEILGDVDTLIFNDNAGVGLAGIRTRLRAMRRAGRPARMLVLDYLQLMRAEGRSESRQLEVSGLSRALKMLGAEFGIPVIVGSQLNRDVEKRAEKRPTIADLRESGSLEQDADIVILLYRDDAYEKESPRSGEIDLIVDKNRNGATSTVTAAFQGHYARIGDMAEAPPAPIARLR